MALEIGLPEFGTKRLQREWKTIATMVRIYCHDHHRAGRVGCPQHAATLCPDCQSLLDYATVRLERCRFGPDKPTCAKCPVHCYLPSRREQVREVMRYAGPKMLWCHPVLAIRHILDGCRKAAL